MEFSRVILRKDGKRVRCSRSFVTRSLYLVARDVSKLDARGSSFYSFLTDFLRSLEEIRVCNTIHHFGISIVAPVNDSCRFHRV